MKPWRKYILAGIITLLLTVFCGIFMEGLPTAYGWWRQFYRMPEQSLKTAFLGSSHCYCTFDPEIFEEALGGNAVQLGSDSMDLVPMEYYIGELLETQMPDRIVIEGYSFIDRGQWKAEDSIRSSRDQAMKAMRWGKNRIEGNRAMFGTEAAWKKLFPFWDNHANWENPGYIETRIKYYLKPDATDKEDRYNKSESVMTEETAALYKKMERNSHKWVMDEDQREAFQRINQCCKAHNIQLIIVMAPIYREWRDHVDYAGRHDQIQALAEEYQVPFIDYNNPALYDTLPIDESCFRDDNSLEIGDTHLNTKGAELISRHLAALIKDGRLSGPF